MNSENKREVIVELGAEGGSITLYGWRTEQGWAFTIEEELFEEEWPDSKLPVVHTWDGALQLLDEYPWSKLRPIFIHAEFRSRIGRALQERMTPERWRDELFLRR